MTDSAVRQTSRSSEPGLLLSIVYASEASVPFSEMDLALLLAVSRSRNEARGVTGLLLYRGGRFMQALEGPEQAVRSVFATIGADPRHTDVRTLDEEMIAERRFGLWAMGYRPRSDPDSAGTQLWFGSTEQERRQDDSRASALLASFRDR